MLWVHNYFAFCWVWDVTKAYAKTYSVVVEEIETFKRAQSCCIVCVQSLDTVWVQRLELSNEWECTNPIGEHR